MVITILLYIQIDLSLLPEARHKLRPQGKYCEELLRKHRDIGGSKLIRLYLYIIIGSWSEHVSLFALYTYLINILYTISFYIYILSYVRIVYKIALISMF